MRIVAGLAALLLGLLSAVPAVAQTISFDGLALRPNGSQVSTYSEDGFTITSGPMRSLNVQGSVGAAPGGVPSVSFLRNGSFTLFGERFTFGGFDGYFTANGTSTILRPITVSGSLGGVQTYSETFGRVTSNDFAPFASQSGTRVFDRLSFTTGNENGSVFLDNIAVTAAVAAAPEPATWGLMILGFGLVGAAFRRRSGGVALAT